ncbi:hypothetical protein JNB62_13110 [Microbacterium jejuense]|uniref:DUF4760 domain-containing protein n=1 Tax=Microbacterium jejuense TaxID=1263637 RepID=A0ABS7HRH3_9MICO|nr:hypothetical protein [Microbacterium jejuense]MBW9094629.1 hypothetical protein [Microbacterium jejuense]
MNPDVTVVVEQPFDFITAVVIPVAAILISALIAIFIAGGERRSSDKAQVRAQAAKLIQALNALGRTAFSDEDDANTVYAQYEQELNAFAAYLGKRDVVVAKFVCVVVDRFDRYPRRNMGRTMLWVATALELWLRGVLTSKDFANNMPSDTSAWIERIDLGQWDAVLRGEPATGVTDVVEEVQKVAARQDRPVGG